MANTFLTPSIIAREALMQLENNLVMAGLGHKDYSEEFVEVGDTITIRKPAKFVAHNFTGSIISQDASEGSVPVKIDRHRDVSFSVTSKEMTLDIKDFSEQLITPAMMAIAQAVDQDILNETANITDAVTATANPTDLKDIANLSKRLDLKKAPVAQRRLVCNPNHWYNYATTDNLAKVAYAGNGDALRNAELGRLFTLDTYMDQNCPDTLAATAGTATAFKITGTQGERKVAVTAATPATGTIKKAMGSLLMGICIVPQRTLRRPPALSRNWLLICRW